MSDAVGLGFVVIGCTAQGQQTHIAGPFARTLEWQPQSVSSTEEQDIGCRWVWHSLIELHRRQPCHHSGLRILTSPVRGRDRSVAACRHRFHTHRGLAPTHREGVTPGYTPVGAGDIATAAPPEAADTAAHIRYWVGTGAASAALRAAAGSAAAAAAVAVVNTRFAAAPAEVLAAEAPSVPAAAGTVEGTRLRCYHTPALHS
jgi:hypothetical protein